MSCLSVAPRGGEAGAELVLQPQAQRLHPEGQSCLSQRSSRCQEPVPASPLRRARLHSDPQPEEVCRAVLSDSRAQRLKSS